MDGICSSFFQPFSYSFSTFLLSPLDSFLLFIFYLYLGYFFPSAEIVS